ncbi:MAG: arsenate reductase ArsC [Pseudomonadota bacterium]
MANPVSLLFLCTGNSCRSQMAEGWLRHRWPQQYKAFSAGIETHGLNPNAVRAMAEAGIDISDQQSQHIDEFAAEKLDYVISVCGHADEHCPVFPGDTTRLHHAFDDPPKLAANAASDEEAMQHYRRVRDDIQRFVEHLPDWLEDNVR